MSFNIKAPTTAEASEAGFSFEPRYPNGDGIGATITVCGPESRAARAQTRAQIKRLQALEMTAKKHNQPADHLSLVLGQDADESARLKAETAASYTLGWKGFTDGDAELACTEDTKRAIFAAHPWIAEQVIAQAQDLGNFVKPPSRPWSPMPQPSSVLT